MKIWAWELWDTSIEEPYPKPTLIRCKDWRKVKARIYEKWKSSVVSNKQEKEESICGICEKEVKSSHIATYVISGSTVAVKK